jgi:ribosomal protein S18 acetylase RimI-like enzyme
VSSVEIRTARLSDTAAIADIFRAASLSNDGDRAALLANPDALVFDETPVREGRTRVAVMQEQVVGFATTRPTGDSHELDDLFVDPTFMRHGLARRLIADAVDRARATHSRRIEVTANGHALSFYRAVGFELGETTDTEFGPGYRMHLDIHRDQRGP